MSHDSLSALADTVATATNTTGGLLFTILILCVVVAGVALALRAIARPSTNDGGNGGGGHDEEPPKGPINDM